MASMSSADGGGGGWCASSFIAPRVGKNDVTVTLTLITHIHFQQVPTMSQNSQKHNRIWNKLLICANYTHTHTVRQEAAAVCAAGPAGSTPNRNNWIKYLSAVWEPTDGMSRYPQDQCCQHVREAVLQSPSLQCRAVQPQRLLWPAGISGRPSLMTGSSPNTTKRS